MIKTWCIVLSNSVLTEYERAGLAGGVLAGLLHSHLHVDVEAGA
jgi:hypothetical protein